MGSPREGRDNVDGAVEQEQQMSAPHGVPGGTRDADRRVDGGDRVVADEDAHGGEVLAIEDLVAWRGIVALPRGR